MKLITLLILICVKLTNERHFKGGSMSYKPIQKMDKSFLVEVETHFSWLRSNGPSFYCNQTMVDSSSVELGEKFSILCSQGCDKTRQTLFDLKNNLFTTSTFCMSWSIDDDWSLGAKKTQLFLPAARNLELSFASNAWIALAQNGLHSANPASASNFELRLSLNLLERNDTGKINSSPTTLVPPVFKLAFGFKHQIRIPVLDEDNDVIRCRWASHIKKECAGFSFSTV